MTYLVLVLATVLAIDVSSVRADPISTFRVMDATMIMHPNIGGTGDHLTFAFTAPGMDISGFGGMENCFAWCTGDPIAPGVGITLTRIVVSNYTRTVLGGVTYDPSTEFSVSSPFFFNDTGGLNPTAMGFVGSGPTFAEFRMTLPTNGSWNLNFAQATDENGNATTRFVGGTFAASAMAQTPDPGTLGLMLIGSAGLWIVGVRRKSEER